MALLPSITIGPYSTIIPIAIITLDSHIARLLKRSSNLPLNLGVLPSRPFQVSHSEPKQLGQNWVRGTILAIPNPLIG